MVAVVVHSKNMRRILLILFVLVTISCFGQKAKYKYYPKRKNILTLKQAEKKEPSTVKHIIIQEYSDSVFPNSDILKYENIETLIVSGRPAKNNKNDSIVLSPIKLDINVKPLQNLRTLSLSYFDFSTFPLEFLNLKKLRYLELAVSFINNIPKEIQNLDSLTHLSFRLNNLTNLPSEISNLNLSAIDLANNNLHHLPKPLIEIKTLKVISLANLETNVSQPNGLWDWPYLLNINEIDYLKEFSTLKSIADKENINVVIQVPNQEIKELLKSKMTKNMKKSINFRITEK